MPNMDVSLDELIASNAKQASKKPGRGGGGRGRGGGRGGRGITKPGKRAVVVKKNAGGGGGGGRKRQGAEVKIGAVTDIKLAAGAVANMMREGTPPKVLAISPTCVNAAVKTLALARRYLEEEGLELMATVDFPEFDESANSVSLSLSLKSPPNPCLPANPHGLGRLLSRRTSRCTSLRSGSGRTCRRSRRSCKSPPPPSRPR